MYEENILYIHILSPGTEKSKENMDLGPCWKKYVYAAID